MEKNYYYKVFYEKKQLYIKKKLINYKSKTRILTWLVLHIIKIKHGLEFIKFYHLDFRLYKYS